MYYENVQEQDLQNKIVETVLQETLRKRADRGKRKKNLKAEADDTWGD